MKRMMRHARIAAVCCLTALVIASCARVGRNFPTDPVANVKIGITTQDDVRRMFGEPWRIGVDNGKRTWTYGYYRYSLFGETITRDLVVTFRDDGVVDSYSFNTSEVDDERYR